MERAAEPSDNEAMDNFIQGSAARKKSEERRVEEFVRKELGEEALIESPIAPSTPIGMPPLRMGSITRILQERLAGSTPATTRHCAVKRGGQDGDEEGGNSGEGAKSFKGSLMRSMGIPHKR